MIIFIKGIHTAIWGIMTMSVGYIGYSVYTMRFDSWFFFALFLITGEILVIILNAWRCPLTNIARRYTDEDTPNFDIYLPTIIAKYNKEIFTVILSLILYVYNAFIR